VQTHWHNEQNRTEAKAEQHFVAPVMDLDLADFGFRLIADL
jgi:hypothetical protein